MFTTRVHFLSEGEDGGGRKGPHVPPRFPFSRRLEEEEASLGNHVRTSGTKNLTSPPPPPAIASSPASFSRKSSD